MAEIRKGIVTQVLQAGAIIRPYGSGNALTPVLPGTSIQVVMPGNNGEPLRFEYLHSVLSVGDSVAFTIFEDGTGYIIAKL